MLKCVSTLAYRGYCNLQVISHAIKSVVINSKFKIFAGSLPLNPQMKLASLAPAPLIGNPGYAPGVWGAVTQSNR